MKEKPIFEVSVYFVHKTEEGPRERSLSILYRAKNEKWAIIQGLAWAENRDKSCFSEFGGKIACVKIHAFEVYEPDATGYIRSGRFPFHIYEWKYDWGTTFEQELEKARRAG
jgi:hypothetical protein